MDYNKIQEEWSVLQGDYEGRPTLMRINTGLKPMVGDKTYANRVGIAIPLKNPEPNGLPTEQENEFFNQIEDEIFACFEEDQKGFMAAIITTNGMKEFMIYSRLDNVQDIIERLKSKFANYDFQNYLTKDENWEEYKRFNIIKE